MRDAGTVTMSERDLVRARYRDFGPTLAREKLFEEHGLVVSTETLRGWMTNAGLWVPRSQHRGRVHQPRGRRSCVGQLIQIDGCDPAWFEERAPQCTLLVCVDDATSRPMEVRCSGRPSARGVTPVGRIGRKRGRPDIATWENAGHFYLVLTCRETQLDRSIHETPRAVVHVTASRRRGRSLPSSPAAFQATRKKTATAPDVPASAAGVIDAHQ